MGIMVFLPDYDGTSSVEIIARGGGALVEDGIDIVPTMIAKGPGDRPGVLFTSWPFHDPKEYDAASQTWMESKPGGKFWVGYVTERKPTPEMLVRRKLIPGEPVVLEDNRIWMVPCSDHVPKRYTRDIDGDEKEIVKDEHREWFDKSNEIYGLILAQGYGPIGNSDYVINIPGGFAYAVESLAKNYRVNADVVDLLELLDKENISELILAACGITRLARLVEQKKSPGQSFQPTGQT